MAKKTAMSQLLAILEKHETHELDADEVRELVKKFIPIERQQMEDAVRKGIEISKVYHEYDFDRADLESAVTNYLNKFNNGK